MAAIYMEIRYTLTHRDGYHLDFNGSTTFFFLTTLFKSFSVIKTKVYIHTYKNISINIILH